MTRRRGGFHVRPSADNGHAPTEVVQKRPLPVLEEEDNGFDMLSQIIQLESQQDVNEQLIQS